MPGLEMGNGGGVIVTTTGGIARLIFLAKRHDASLADSVADRDKCSNVANPAFQLPQGGTRSALSMVVTPFGGLMASFNPPASCIANGRLE